MKVLKTHKNEIVLEPLKNYLINNGIHAQVKMQWHQRRMSVPFDLLCPDEEYEEALRILDEIDTFATDDGIPLTDENGLTAEEKIARTEVAGKWLLRVLLLAMVGGFIYLVVSTM